MCRERNIKAADGFVYFWRELPSFFQEWAPTSKKMLGRTHTHLKSPYIPQCPHKSWRWQTQPYKRAHTYTQQYKVSQNSFSCFFLGCANSLRMWAGPWRRLDFSHGAPLSLLLLLCLPERFTSRKARLHKKCSCNTIHQEIPVSPLCIQQYLYCFCFCCLSVCLLVNPAVYLILLLWTCCQCAEYKSTVASNSTVLVVLQSNWNRFVLLYAVKGPYQRHHPVMQVFSTQWIRPRDSNSVPKLFHLRS